MPGGMRDSRDCIGVIRIFTWPVMECGKGLSRGSVLNWTTLELDSLSLCDCIDGNDDLTYF